MYDQITLPNGLRIIGERLTHVRSCTVGCWVNVGSRNEAPQENGLSHFIEHMVFKGTKNRTARQLAEEMDLVGGQMNAYTSKECTCFYAKVTDDELELAVDLLSDLVLRPTFDPAEMDKERGVVLEEIAMSEDEPDDLVMELLADAQYSGSLRRPILGTEALLQRYTREELVGYWQRHYTPANMVLAISGNYDWDAFLALVDRYFRDFPNENQEAAPYSAQSFVCGRTARSKDTEQIHIAIGFPGVESYHPDAYPMAVLSNALGGGMSSRLFQRIREELGMAYSIFTYPASYRGIGSFNIYAGTSPENAKTVIREIRQEIDKFLQDGMTEREYKCAKAQVRGGYLLGLESSSGRMQSIGRSLLLGDRAEQPDEIIAKIDAVTPEGTMALARRLLTAEHSAAVVGRDAGKVLKYFK